MDERKLYAVVHQNDPQRIVSVTGAPFDAESQEAAEKEVCLTYTKYVREGAHLWLRDAGWLVVPLTEELEKQYREIGALEEPF